MNWVLCHWVRAELHSSMPRAQRKPGIVKLALKRQKHKQNKTIFTKPKQSISRFISLAEQFRDPPMTPRSHLSHLPIKRKQTSPMSDPRFLEVLFKLTWKTKNGEISHVTRMKPTTVWRKTWKNKKKSAKKYRGKSTKPRLILQNVFWLESRGANFHKTTRTCSSTIK